MSPSQLQPPRHPILLDMIGKLITPTETLLSARVFVFGPVDSQPGFVMVYVAKDGKPALELSSTIDSFTRSRHPRREPHTISTPTQTWDVSLAGCGCGSPIKRMIYNTASKDWAALQEANVDSDWAVGVSGEEELTG